jgi:hypothetical protein
VVSLAVRAEAVLDRLAGAGVPAMVRADPSGWTAVRLGPVDPAPAAAATGGLVLAAVATETDLVLRGWRDGQPLPADPAALAGAVGRPDADARLRAVLGDGDREPAERAAAAAALLGVPAGLLVDDPPAREVAVGRAEAGPAGTVAAVAGGGWLAEDGGWALLTGPDGGSAVPLAGGLSGIGRRNGVGLWLWQDGDEGGYVVWRRGRPLDGHGWLSGWEATPAADRAGLGPAVGDPVVLAEALGRPDAVVPLRALLRRRDPAGTALPELARLLGLPPAVPAVLSGTAVRDLPGARLVEARSVWAATRAELAADEAAAPPPGRFRVAGMAVSALAATGVAGRGLVGLVTGGPGWVDAGRLVLFGAVAAASTRTALRLHRLRDRPGP